MRTSQAREITRLRLVAFDEYGRPSQLPADELHACGQDSADAQKHKPEQHQERDREDCDDSIEDRQGCALLSSK